MDAKRLLIVGGVAGGASAAARARRLSETSEIIVFERGPHVSFANCGLPYYVGGEIEEEKKLIVQTPDGLRSRFNLDIRVNSEVTAVDAHMKRIEVRDLQTGKNYSESYDDLILSTGAAPLMPPIPGIDRPGHFTVRNIPDVEAIMDWVKLKQARSAVIVGGGYIGLEMAEQLHHRGLAVAIAEALPQVMAPLDPEMAAWLHAELRSRKISLHLGDAVARFEAPGDHEPAAASVVVLKSGARLAADLVILGLGVKPETGLARGAGLAIGERGGIRVNDRLQTSDPHIWAVGDAIEVRDVVTGGRTLIPLAGPANRQGRIAAGNIFGRAGKYPGTLGTAILRLFDLSAACTGASEKTLSKLGVPFQAVHLHPASHAGYYPGAHPVALKIIFSPESGKLLGAQAVGHEGVDKRIDVLATALKVGMTVDDLVNLELEYAPPSNSARDPVNQAGMVAQNVLRKDVDIVQWHEVDALCAEQALLLDVRDDAEREAGAIPGSLHIPLPQLRQRLHELPKDREIITHCQTGQRSYIACRILTQHGFKARNLTGSYRTWKIARDHGPLSGGHL